MENKPKNPIGRPSKYGECLPRAQEYLMGAWRTVGDVVPSIAGLACFLGVTRECIYEWQRTHDGFSDICNGLLTIQERELANRGLDGTFNGQITKLMLSKHGYSDRVETDNKSSDGSMTPRATVVIDKDAIKSIAESLNKDC